MVAKNDDQFFISPPHSTPSNSKGATSGFISERNELSRHTSRFVLMLLAILIKEKKIIKRNFVSKKPRVQKEND